MIGQAGLGGDPYAILSEEAAVGLLEDHNRHFPDSLWRREGDKIIGQVPFKVQQ